MKNPSMQDAEAGKKKANHNIEKMEPGALVAATETLRGQRKHGARVW